MYLTEGYNFLLMSPVNQNFPIRELWFTTNQTEPGAELEFRPSSGQTWTFHKDMFIKFTPNKMSKSDLL